MPNTIEEAKSFCDLFADKVKEAQRQNALENEYTKNIRLLYLKVGELDNILKLLDERKTQKRVAEYEQIYNELLEITEKQNRLNATTVRGHHRQRKTQTSRKGTCH